MNIESLWEEFSLPLKNYISRRVNNQQDVEDILQDVFYKIHKNICNLNNTEKIHAWIYRITKNAIIDFYRAQKNQMNHTELLDDIISQTQDEVNANDEIAECLKSMVQNLPEKYKHAIILTEFENLTQKELGKRMGLSESGAKSRVQRARVKLKEMVLGCCQLEFDSMGNIIDYERQGDNCKYC